MAFKSLHNVLGGLQHSYKRQEQQQLQQVIDCWPDTVGPIVAAQTRPLMLNRGVLKVATASAVWAQNLVFERQRILTKLNQTSALAITDIRFSPAQWQEQPSTTFPGELLQQELWQAHPSRYPHSDRQIEVHLGATAPSVKLNSPHLEPPKTSQDAMRAFRQWSAQMRLRSRQLPLCPECHCPTPPGELHRWAVCAICISKRW
jgi:predicted nucleic acid-binding Zn ribbon protein